MTSRTRVLIASVLALVGLVFSACTSTPGAPAATSTPPATSTGSEDVAQAAKAGWDYVPTLLGRIQAPVFPAKDFDVSQYGAVADGKTLNTEAIAKAIAACHDGGGGRVVISGGTILTGAVHLKSNVNLYIAKGATLKFTPDASAYLPVVYTRYEGTECMNYSPLIYAFEQENLGVTGEGTLDGSASDENWWSWTKRVNGPGSSASSSSSAKLVEMGEKGVPVEQRVFGDQGKLRPNFVQFYRCKNILIEGVHIINSPMWELNPVLSSNITVRNVDIHSHGPNNDGCDPECSRDVLIENCVFDTGDDCIAIKSGKNNDGRRVNVPSENYLIRNCTMQDGHGGVVMGSEITGGCRNVFIENCKMDSPRLERALRFKSNARRGGVVENIFMRNVQIGQVLEAILTVDYLYDGGAKGDFKPVVRNVHVENVTSTASPRILWIVGIPQGTIDEIYFKHCTFGGLSAPEVMHDAGKIVFEDVKLVPAKKTRSLSSRDDPAL